ncbi:MAG: hypothetical protein K8W52_07945 [Deltaproteobacteria bacterium]|nr:hypothetical protein [Deltaproteobacteria bacterium]
MRSVWMTMLLGVVACGSGSTVGGADAKPLPGDAPGGDGVVTAFRRCVGRPFTPIAAAGFATSGGGFTAALGGPVHAAEDVVVPSAPHAVARFAYGALTSALTSEPVAVFIDDCSGWRSLGEVTTDADGGVDVPVGQELAPGVYEATFEVLGDASIVTGYVWSLPAGTHLVISDIDGTLTTSDTELFLQLLNGSYVPTAYPMAPELTTTHADRGHVVVYITGRPYYLTQRTRDWLAGKAFAAGPLHLAPSTGAALPTNGGVGDFKKAWLEELVAKGYILDLAYGNATTDIYAYTGAGIAADHQWIIGTNGGMDGTNAVVDTWAARVTDVAQAPAVAQPFAW